MSILHNLQPLIPMLSAVLAALLADIVLRIAPQLRDRIDPLLGIPARMTARFERKLNRSERDRATRASRGVITLVVMAIVALSLAFLGYEIVLYYPQFEPALWFLCLRVTFPWTTLYELSKNKLNGLAILQRRRVSVLVSTNNPDQHATARMAIEATATSLHRGLLTPVLWGAVAALMHYPALPVAIFVTALLEAERITLTLNDTNSPFALPFHVVEAIINFVPARVSGLLFVLGSLFTPGAHPGDALRGMFVQSEAYRILNAGWPVAALAGALHVALPGGKTRNQWIGPKNATAKAETRDVQRALFLHIVTLGLVVLILTATLFIAIGS